MASKTKTKAPKVDGYQVITDRIVDALEAGTVPWRKPWKSIGGFGPTSLSTGKEYRGINQLMLSMQSFAAGYDSIYWGTYRQMEALGGQVRKGEKGTQVVLWKPFEKEVDGKKERYLMMRLFSVFNAEQVAWTQGCDSKRGGWFGKMPTNPVIDEADYVEPVEKADRIVKGMPLRPEIKHGGDRAFYSPLLDYIGMPPTAAFDSTEGYYATLFHELIHSTGHESRVGRQGIEAFAGFGSESYSKEELVAEIGAAYLCSEAGIEPRIDQSAAYIESWLKVLKGDKKFVVSAAAGAGKATDYILNRDTKGESA
jgi:antirestriction protein ArdC